MIYILNIWFLSLDLRKVPKMSSWVPNKWDCDIFYSFSYIRAPAWPIICYMKVMGTMKKE